MLRTLTLLACLAGAAFGPRAQELPHSQKQAESEFEVRQFVASFVRAFDDMDWAKFRACFAEDATIFYPEFFAHRVQGTLNIDQSWQRVFQNIKAQSAKSQAPYMDLKPADTQVQMLSDAAIVTFHLEHGGTAVGRRTLVLRKSARGWQIVHLHASNVDFGEGK